MADTARWPFRQGTISITSSTNARSNSATLQAWAMQPRGECGRLGVENLGDLSEAGFAQVLVESLEPLGCLLAGLLGSCR